MDEQTAYLKAFIEGRPGLEPFAAWCERNDEWLAAHSRAIWHTWRTSPERPSITAIAAVLNRRGVQFRPCDRYKSHLEPDHCGWCGAPLNVSGRARSCPNGCFDAPLLY